jgi:putative flippase GtrA
MIRQQLIRYAAIGLLLNAALYGAYLLLTHTLMGSRAAMTLTYCSGVLIGFVLNRKITFRYHGDNAGALLRYIASYVIGYAINFMTLWLLVDHAGIAHEIVQGGVIVTLPVVLFALQRYWVFPTRTRHYPALPAQPVP